MSSRSPDSDLIFGEITPFWELQKKKQFSFIFIKLQFFVLIVCHYTVPIIAKTSHPRLSCPALLG